jgi:low temperature requirement protein LtrA
VSTDNGRYRHGLSSMLGRDSTESGRSATPLELLYDLTFVAAFGVAAAQLTHGIVTGHIGTASISFLIAMTTIVWAWTNFTWFASAFDNDDWLFRILTMIQMVGVVVLAIGLPPLFASIEDGGSLDTRLMVAGYVVIRVAVAVLWMRAARADPRYRRVAVTYAIFVGTAQAGWVVLALLRLAAGPALAAIGILFVIESVAPIVAEARGRSTGGVTPWNAHHLAERYSLLAIIALGETVLGTLSAATQISSNEGWTLDAIVVIAAGVVMSLALWWVYFLVPHGPALSARRNRVLPWAYGHIVLFGAIAATGAGLHVVGYAFDREHPLAEGMVVTAVALPVLIFMLVRDLLHALLTSAVPRSIPVHIASIALPVVAIALASLGCPLWICLLVTLASPVAVIVAYELGGWRALDSQLARILERPSTPERKA